MRGVWGPVIVFADLVIALEGGLVEAGVGKQLGSGPTNRAFGERTGVRMRPLSIRREISARVNHEPRQPTC
jgi:hypothetical protein